VRQHNRQNWKELVRLAAEDRIKGAIEIARDAAEAFALAESQNAEPGEILNAVTNFVTRQSAMAPVLRLSAEIKNAIDTGSLKLVTKVAIEWLEKLSDSLHRFEVELIKSFELSVYKPWVFHSSSSTVSEGIKALAAERSIIGDAYVSESSPGSEGVNTAALLSEIGWETVLMPDSVVFDKILNNDIEVVILGCDAFDDKMFVNKSGSGAIASLASSQQIPVELWATTHKILPSNVLGHLDFSQQGNVEYPGFDGQVEQPLFGFGNMKHVSLIRTETGVMKTDDIKMFMNKLPDIPSGLI